MASTQYWCILIFLIAAGVVGSFLYRGEAVIIATFTRRDEQPTGFWLKTAFVAVLGVAALVRAVLMR